MSPSPSSALSQRRTDRKTQSREALLSAIHSLIAETNASATSKPAQQQQSAAAAIAATAAEVKTIGDEEDNLPYSSLTSSKSKDASTSNQSNTTLDHRNSNADATLGTAHSDLSWLISTPPAAIPASRLPTLAAQSDNDTMMIMAPADNMSNESYFEDGALYAPMMSTLISPESLATEHHTTTDFSAFTDAEKFFGSVDSDDTNESIEWTTTLHDGPVLSHEQIQQQVSRSLSHQRSSLALSGDDFHAQRHLFSSPGDTLEQRSALVHTTRQRTQQQHQHQHQHQQQQEQQKQHEHGSTTYGMQSSSSATSSSTSRSSLRRAAHRPHSVIERRYRAGLQDKFKMLRDCVAQWKSDEADVVEDEAQNSSTPMNKASVLVGAVDCINQLKEENDFFFEQIEAIVEALRSLQYALAHKRRLCE